MDRSVVSGYGGQDNLIEVVGVTDQLNRSIKNSGYCIRQFRMLMTDAPTTSLIPDFMLPVSQTSWKNFGNYKMQLPLPTV